MKTIVLFTSLGIANGLLLVNIYTSVIDARSWGSDIPNSIAAAREYFKVVNPGNFFRIFSPVNQALALLVVVLFWAAAPSVRLYLLAAFVLYVLADVLTYAYFYPRNNILFTTAPLSNVDLLKKTWQQWSFTNWLRSLLLLIGISCSFTALHKIYMLYVK